MYLNVRKRTSIATLTHSGTRIENIPGGQSAHLTYDTTASVAFGRYFALISYLYGCALAKYAYLKTKKCVITRMISIDNYESLD